MEPAVYEKFRSLVYQTSGIQLGSQKQALVAARISKRMRLLGLNDFIQYYDVVQRYKSGQELVQLIDAISTNVTHFFREDRHFAVLADLTRTWEQAGRGAPKVWCAACSTGEEPYSILMTLLNAQQRATTPTMVASDISTRVLQTARQGIYRDEDVRTVPRPLLRRFFQEGTGQAESLFRVKPEYRKLVDFRQINLSTPPYPVPNGLDAIFCRNVMIYFNRELRSKLVNQFIQLLRPNGYLFVGMAESLSGMSPRLQSTEPSVYRLIS